MNDEWGIIEYAILKLMAKFVVAGVVIVILAVGGFLLYQSFQTKQTTPTLTTQAEKTPTPATETGDSCEILTKGSSDVPPLYKEGVTWQQPKITEYDVALAENSKRLSGCLIKSAEMQFSPATNVRSFYTNKMLSRGWSSISSSDLPGEAGSDTWSKNSQLFLVEVYPASKPSVQVRLFLTQ